MSAAVNPSLIRGFYSLVMVAKNGDPHELGLNSIENYRAADATQKITGKGFPAFTPEFQGQYMHPITKELPADATPQQVQETVVAEYKKAVADGRRSYGPFGDYIMVSLVGCIDKVVVVVNQIAHKAFPKPAVATDIGLFIKGFKTLPSGIKEAVIYGIFIKRAQEPGKGHEATIGGFNNVKKDKQTGIEYFASPMSTAMSEAGEEVTSRIKLDKEALKDYNLHKIQGQITLGKLGARGRDFDANFEYLGCFKTGDQLMKDGGEQIEGSQGQKRVHITHGVLGTVNVPADIELTQATVETWFKAADDALKVVVTDVTQQIKESTTKETAKAFAARFFRDHQMGIRHHETVLASLFERAHSVFYPTRVVSLISRFLAWIGSFFSFLRRAPAPVRA